jgi:penicillin-binding protein 1A
LGRGEEGSRTALPIWVKFMGIALKGVPENQMAMPDGMVMQRIDKETGCPAGAGHRNATFEYFREGHVPDCDVPDDEGGIFNDASGVDPVEDEETEGAVPLF